MQPTNDSIQKQASHPDERRGLSIGVLAMVALALLSGCTTGRAGTWVEGGLKPSHFQFKEVVPKRGKGAGGWRAACLHVGILRANTEELFYCRFGVEVPIENEKQGFIPIEMAQSRAASSANQAALTTLQSTTPATPIAIACAQFKRLYGLTLGAVIYGARIMHTCSPGVPPVVLTPRALLP